MAGDGAVRRGKPEWCNKQHMLRWAHFYVGIHSMSRFIVVNEHTHIY
jgi:hypothetical protein